MEAREGTTMALCLVLQVPQQQRHHSKLRTSVRFRARPESELGVTKRARFKSPSSLNYSSISSQFGCACLSSRLHRDDTCTSVCAEVTDKQSGIKQSGIEKLWLQFFADPSEWWDIRSCKTISGNPAFKHKKSKEVLWLDGWLNPPWVKTKLASSISHPPESDTSQGKFVSFKNKGLQDPSVTDKQKTAEQLWRNLFADPSQWWDHRLDKNARYPDFKHKETKQGIWIAAESTPEWAKIQVAAMRPGTVQRSIFSWNMAIAGYVKDGQCRKALELFRQMRREHVNPDKFTYVQVLKACTSLGALEEGQHLHAQILESRYDSDVFVGSALVHMYVKCGSIENASRVFYNMPARDVVSWSTLISGYVKCGRAANALELYIQMQQELVEADNITFLSVLNACACLSALEEGRLVHAQIIHRRCESDSFVASSLIDMYGKCGNIKEAVRVFNNMPVRTLVSWNAMIVSFVKCRQAKNAFELFQRMQCEQIEPDCVTFVGVLNACASMGAIEEGRHVHAQVLQRGHKSNVIIACCLVDFYSKCGSIEDACKVFNDAPSQDVAYWNAMIAGHRKCSQGKSVFELFYQMLHQGIKPDSLTFVGVLEACACVTAIEEGRQVHAHIIQIGFESDNFLMSCLVGMYAKCDSIEDACRVFNHILLPDLVSWNSLILGYLKCDLAEKALELCQQMKRQCVQPDGTTFVAAIKACGQIAAIEEGRWIHSQIIGSSHESDLIIGTCLVEMYAKCGSIEDASRVFNIMPVHDVVSWSVMISGYVNCGDGDSALDLFRMMQQDGVEADKVSFLAALNACAIIRALEEGKYVHALIVRSGYESDIAVGSCLVDMYCKCSSIEDASSVFNTMATHDVVSWNAMISGYMNCGQAEKALELFWEMQEQDVEPDQVTFVATINACANVAALEEGRRIHELVIRSRGMPNTILGSCLVDMYAKCGSINDAWRVFNHMPARDVLSWNAMLGGYAMHGLGKEAFRLFEKMCRNDVAIDSMTIVYLLSALSRAGLLDEGCYYYESSTPVYVSPVEVEHHGCMVALLGRASHLDEAEDIINSMPCHPSISIWMSLLAACRVHGNVKMGELVAKRILVLDPESACSYVLLSNIYGATGNLGGKEKVQKIRTKRHVYKQPGQSWIEVNNCVHTFVVNDKEHPKIEEIRAELQSLYGRMKAAGYVANRDFEPHEAKEGKNDFAQHFHSERLAIAFGLITTPPGTPLRILKNLRVCVDCHTTTKFISKIVRRTIIVRDLNLFHHIEDGVCSCGDYW
ncbi:hypothetical protein O6H91_11G100200 [Diphasiastrum complanatum]|uniref:Uncharacterized protein n=2 Tax=Diphasiastrum complanatum TaxID=34168 RepID=A0ACC2CBZ2_DIPCM|nr:hypothetical protein O6H91_11G100200 [Diphasiastrum complanatum]KAJ7539562.1 hypothetical protein O6H91_11G100200 [Diphasiastrum complanatum]